jgi:hypothetical protein
MYLLTRKKEPEYSTLTCVGGTYQQADLSQNK